MRCLVTGGAGFIGSTLVDALAARGDEVAVIDNLSSGRRENLTQALAQGARFHEADVRDAPRLIELFRLARPEVVFHVAAQVDVRVSMEQPFLDAEVNVLGTIATLDASRAAGVRRVVNSSTGGGLYGEAEVLPTGEDQPILPLAPYGQGKLAAESYCEMSTRAYGLSTISLRYGNVYGPRQSADGEAGVVAIFCGCLASGCRPTVFGDGRQTRDWVDVEDVVRANLLAADSEVTGPVNIGTGRETSVLELIEALRAQSGGGALADLEFAPERPGEVRRSCLEISRARRELGWEPQVELRVGLRRILTQLPPL